MKELHKFIFMYNEYTQKQLNSLCLCAQWEVPPDYINVILGIKDNLTKDLVYILMAKGLHCISIKVCMENLPQNK